MKELKHLNKYLLKYKKKLLFGFFITIIARVFSLVAPRLIGNSLTAVEYFIKNNSRTDIVTLQKTLLINISIIIGTALISGFFFRVGPYTVLLCCSEILERSELVCYLSFFVFARRLIVVLI